MKRLTAAGIVLLVFTMTATSQTNKTFHDFTVKTLEGEDFDLAQLKGKKVLVVNTASKCGYTPQYEGLQKLYEEYGGEKFTVIGFPSNDFMHQEPGTNEEIRAFCSTRYGVTFPMMAKITVKGKNRHPVYRWLTKRSENGVINSSVKWNFQKYMVNEDGTIAGKALSRTKPYDPLIVNWIEGKQEQN
jgi:glutathione peroxidase